MFSGFGAGGLGGNDIGAFIGLEGINQFQNDIGKADTSVKKLEGTFKVSGAVIAAAAAGIGIAAAGMATKIISGSINAAKEFEFLRVRLQNMFGDVEKGNQAFEEFNKIAATTPFELLNVVEAGANLKAMMGDTFSQENLKMAADLAAFMGTDIVDAAQAMGRAFAGGAGAADILREKGILNLIKTKQQIDDFKNVTLEEFRTAMFKTFTDPTSGIVGATDKLSQTIVGLESNASDAFTQLKAVIGEKFLPVYKESLETAINITQSFIDLFTDWGTKVENAAQNAAMSFKKMTTVADFSRTVAYMDELLKLLLKSGDIKQIQWLAQSFSFLTTEQKFALQGAKDFWEGAKILGEIILDLKDKIDKTDPAFKNFNMNLDAIDLDTGKVISGLEFVNKSVENSKNQFKSFTIILKDLNYNFEEFVKNTEIVIPFNVELPDPQPFWDMMQPIEELGVSADRTWEIIAAGASRTASFVTESFFDKKVQFKQLWQSIAKDFIQMFLEEILQQTIKYVAKLIALLIFFDKYENDMRAMKSGRDYAKFFSTGVIDGLQKNLDPSIMDRLTAGALDLSGSIREGLNGEQILKVEVETVPIEDARARAYFIRQNRNVIMPDQDYINTFLRTKKGEFDK
ncbi:MAG: hypothetical protein A2Y94_13930 [Caldithrix sp. RBG_13_44_9]|nr:MAG: hypothetical protein A2Y94_13930 [Caldithrix sp. RBG_13_44_9]